MKNKIVILLIASMHLVYGVDLDDVERFEHNLKITEDRVDAMPITSTVNKEDKTLYQIMSKYRSSEAKAIAMWAKVLYETQDRTFYKQTVRAVRILLQKMLFDKQNPMDMGEYTKVKQMLKISENKLVDRTVVATKCRTQTDLNLRYLPFYTSGIGKLTKVMTFQKSTLLEVIHLLTYGDDENKSRWGYISDIDGNKGWINLQYCHQI